MAGPAKAHEIIFVIIAAITGLDNVMDIRRGS